VSLIRRLGALFDRPLPPATDTTVPRSAAELAQLAQNVEREHPRLAWEVRAIASHLRTFETATAARSGNTR
jgi:poly-beta-hydroxyalkanoate depolymerase